MEVTDHLKFAEDKKNQELVCGGGKMRAITEDRQSKWQFDEEMWKG